MLAVAAENGTLGEKTSAEVVVIEVAVAAVVNCWVASLLLLFSTSFFPRMLSIENDERLVLAGGDRVLSLQTLLHVELVGLTAAGNIGGSAGGRCACSTVGASCIGRLGSWWNCCGSVPVAAIAAGRGIRAVG